MLALVLLFSSAFNPVETGLKEGKQAPMLKLKNSEGAVTLSELKGRYVLLNFWAGYDAPSRMENIRFAREIDKSEIENISLVFGIVRYQSKSLRRDDQTRRTKHRYPIL